MSSREKQIDLFLLGKTGHGKSSTGNSILGREAFQVSDSSESETYVVQVGWARRLRRLIKVVDGPGVCETRLDRGPAAKKMVDDMAAGIMQCPDGFHALVLVLKYGNRFTEEELSVVQSLKSLFGQNFVKEYCIVIFTHGELFDMNNRKNPRPFSDWCREQKGAMQTLLDECRYKALLFYNMDENKSDSQLEELCSLAEGLNSDGRRYTNEMFAKVAKEREQLIVRENAPHLREAIQAKIDLLIDGVNSVKDVAELDEGVKEKFKLLREDAKALEVEISVQDKGTGVLSNLKQVVQNIQASVDSQEKALTERKSKQETELALAKAKEEYNNSLAKLRAEQNKRKKPRGWLREGVDWVDENIISPVVESCVLM